MQYLCGCAKDNVKFPKIRVFYSASKTQYFLGFFSKIGSNSLIFEGIRSRSFDRSIIVIEMTEINNNRKMTRNFNLKYNKKVIEGGDGIEQREVPLDMRLMKLLFVSMAAVVAYALSWTLLTI